MGPCLHSGSSLPCKFKHAGKQWKIGDGRKSLNKSLVKDMDGHFVGKRIQTESTEWRTCNLIVFFYTDLSHSSGKDWMELREFWKVLHTHFCRCQALPINLRNCGWTTFLGEKVWINVLKLNGNKMSIFFFWTVQFSQV